MLDRRWGASGRGGQEGVGVASAAELMQDLAAVREPLRELRELRDAGLLPEIEYRDGARPSLLVERL